MRGNEHEVHTRMIELLLEVLGEFLVQVAGEALIELGLHSVAEPFRSQPNPWLAGCGYAIFGTIFGAISVLIFPSNFVPRPWRVVNLIVTPLAVGASMALIGAWRTRRGQSAPRIDRFAYGYVFALALALVRFRYAA
jgi:VIT1/CCC1 family predicted Fe2+/Mn2+ transporter